MTFNRLDGEAWPAPWVSQHAHFIKRFGDVRHQYWSEPLVMLMGGLPTPLNFDDPVLSGMARKAAQVMRNTCTACGRPGKVLKLGGGWAVRCGRCCGKSLLVNQIQDLVDALDSASELAPFGATAVWHEHDLPMLLRSSIPSFCWRCTVPPRQGPLRYLAREDIEMLMPWLNKLASVMKEN